MAETKKIKANVKFRLTAGKASPAPPVGSILGAQGVNMMEFVNGFNEATKELGDVQLAVRVAIFEDRSFTFTFKGEPTANLIRKAAGIQKGAGNPVKDKVATLSRTQVQQIAEQKMPDLSANDPEAAFKVIAGTARSMGVSVEK
ncbi:MAG TPA: 50S ribosomal protein L11 [Candidatus Saccharimonadales bacterium]|nr:50S ribosomal protein L11 [Candidatus Saccharimonadales bacterium]